MGTDDKLFQKAIEQIATKIRKETPKKKWAEVDVLEEARRRYDSTVTSLGFDAFNADDRDTTDPVDVACFLHAIGIEKGTAARLAPFACERIAEIALDGPD
ncbi:hypothetical protein HYT05_01635 [Candidatus Kaiserbacteria bacterium]|nr:hypothetical protein [Candidatus Kaiserbacteria bacterium]